MDCLYKHRGVLDFDEPAGILFEIYRNEYDFEAFLTNLPHDVSQESWPALGDRAISDVSTFRSVMRRVGETMEAL